MNRTTQSGLRFIATQAGLATGLVLLAGQAAAQQPYPQQYPQQQPAYPQQQPAYPQQQAQQPQPAYQAQAQVAPQMPAAPAKADDSDQGKVVGHMGIGWFGTLAVPVSAAGGTVSAPLVGLRYWLGPSLGIDAALGFTTSSSSRTVDAGGMSTTTDGPSTTAFAAHFGLPLVLGNTQHLSVQLTPEANLGFASNPVKGGSITMPGVGDMNNSGLLISVGARAGGEMFFGFIGLPSLSLEASVGLFLSSLSGKSEDTGVGGATQKGSALNISTLSLNQPWQLFTQNIAARYYF